MPFRQMPVVVFLLLVTVVVNACQTEHPPSKPTLVSSPAPSTALFLEQPTPTMIGGEGTAQERKVVTIPPVQDTTIYSESDTLGNGNGGFLFAGTTNQGAVRRALLKFDVSGSVPVGSRVTDAKLSLVMNRTKSTSSSEVSVHVIEQAWGEGISDADSNEGQGAEALDGDATWSSAMQGTISWRNPGGDFRPKRTGSRSIERREIVAWSGVGLIEDVQRWVDAPISNHGWILLGDESTDPTAKRFSSREGTDAPSLTIKYVPGR